MKTILLITSLVLVSVGFAETKIYKKVDKDGNITYTDQKPHEGAKEADLPGLTIVESSPVTNKERSQYGKGIEKPDDDSVNLFSSFKITSPSFEQTIINSGGVLNTSVAVNGKLPKKYGIKFFVNSTPSPIINSTNFSFNNIIRGEHEVYAQAINIANNKVIKTTPKIKFFMRQHVKKR